MINHRIIGQGLLSLKGIMIQILKKTKKQNYGQLFVGKWQKKNNRLFSIRELSS